MRRLLREAVVPFRSGRVVAFRRRLFRPLATGARHDRAKQRRSSQKINPASASAALLLSIAATRACRRAPWLSTSCTARCRFQRWLLACVSVARTAASETVGQCGLAERLGRLRRRSADLRPRAGSGRARRRVADDRGVGSEAARSPSVAPRTCLPNGRLSPRFPASRVTLAPLVRCNSVTTPFRMASNAFTGRTTSISTEP